jgi:ubiquinone/menaquinone biosynthesis C-methylase UbiE
MSDHFSFDERVADRYNLQRAHPPQISEQIAAAIQAALPDGARVLEIGVGTGRIALPLAAIGVSVTGIDISPKMLAQVTSANLRLVQADMLRMPFAADSFNGALAVHVLHLAKDLEGVLGEIARTLRPDGMLIQGEDWIDPKSVVGFMRDELRRYVAELRPDMMPPAAQRSRADLIRDLGGTETTETVAAEWTLQVSPAERLRAIEERKDAESWILPQPLFEKVLAHMREVAAATWSDLEARQPVTRRFNVKVTRGDW